MSAVVFLLLAVIIVGVVGAWLWYHERRPTSIEDGVEGFRRELDALAPDRRMPGRRTGTDDSGVETTGPVGPGGPRGGSTG